MPLFPIFLVLLSAFFHAGWNLIAHAQRQNRTLLLRTSLVAGVVGLGPVLALELRAPVFSLPLWGLLALAGLFLATYYLGLAMGYRNGEFSVVYPLARALPILVLAAIDTLRGRPLSAAGWLGAALVFAGCFVAPLESLRDVRLARYWNRTSGWIILTALSTVGYTTVDKIAAELLAPGPLTAARYGVVESLLSVPFLWLMLVARGERFRHELLDRGTWKWPAIATLFVFGGYWLVLWAYQLSSHASYVVTLRQFSIVIGVIVAALVFREPAPRLRLGAALAITAGVICIASGG